MCFPVQVTFFKILKAASPTVCAAVVNGERNARVKGKSALAGYWFSPFIVLSDILWEDALSYEVIIAEG
ncbi:MAG: hypothetical protein LBH04_06325 [Tannerellaceae bacterium]|nr:hypothetical protein [Tannerellaceae bacterium]